MWARLSNIASVITISFTLSFFIFSVIWINYPDIVSENHIIENIQVAFLLIGFLFFIYLSFNKKISVGKVLYLSLSIFYITFATREIELEISDSWYAIIFNSPVRNYWTGGLWGICFIIFFLNMKETFRFFLVWIKLIQGSYILTGGLFYLL